MNKKSVTCESLAQGKTLQIVQGMADLEIFDDGDSLYVDSRLIAERLGIEHRSFLVTLDNYQTQIEQAFGILRFEIAEIDGRGSPVATTGFNGC